MIKYAEFCAGIGGFRLGIEQSLYKSECVYSNEIDEKCENTYFLNFGEKFNSKDIFEVNANSIPQIDILCSGFPCQPFSIAGKQRGLEDTRGKIILKLSEIIHIIQPKVIFLENVANLKNHNKGETLRFIKKMLENNGYDVYENIINSMEFGIPQSRPRLYIIGFNRRKNGIVNFQFPKGNGKKKTIRDILAKGDYSIPISKKWEEYVEYYTGRKRESDLSFEIPKTRKKLERVSELCDLEDCILQIRSSGIRAYSLDLPFPTFAVSNSGGGAMIPVLTKEKRHISILEMKRLMGFPDEYKFNVSRTDSIKQLANAVCPPVIREIFDEIVVSSNLDAV